MCGIAGIVSSTPYISPLQLDAMRDALKHRGPDGAGTWWSSDGRVGLAHRRLAILDVSPRGAQPMASADGRLVLTFNGEIYNYKEIRSELSACGYSFSSDSDTEVLLSALHAWGEAALQKIDGMFAFAVYDQLANRLMLARDRVGEKPLFWSQDDGLFSFASELKGLLARPGQKRVLSPEGLDSYLAYGSVKGDLSILDGVQKLPPANYLILDGGDFMPRVRQYWDLPNPDVEQSGSVDELAFELRSLLRRSVRRQLVADVPVGVLLSGGVDSSILTAISAEVSSEPIRTFTVGFREHPDFDERPYAKAIATHFGTLHTELEADAASLSLLEQLAAQFDEPMCDSSMIPTYLVSALVRQHCTVVLGGDGGDELFGGYRSYQGAIRLAYLRSMMPAWIRKSVGVMAQYGLPVGYPRRNGLRGLAKEDDDAEDWGMFFDARTRFQLCPWLKSRRRAGDVEKTIPRLALIHGVPGAWMANDFRGYLADDILVKVDRASMMNSLEVRAPFLDRAICEWAFRRVPNKFRCTEYERKIVPRKLASELLPPNFDLRRKQGFSIPLASWLERDDVRNPIVEQISDGGLFDKKWVRYLSSKCQIERAPELFFSLWLFECWRGIYEIKI